MVSKQLGNAERKRRGLTVDGNCLVCSGQEKTIEHIFKTCTKATHVWNNIGGNVDTNTGGGMKDWIHTNLLQKRNNDIDGDRGVIFATTYWWIWWWRNAMTFGMKELDDRRKPCWIKETLKETNTAFVRQQMVSNSTNYTDHPLKWRMAQNCEWTLNVDGSCKSLINKAGISGILRNRRGGWKGGFTANVSPNCATSVEVMVIARGIEWAWEKGIKELEVQTDASEVIKWMTDYTSLRGPNRDIIDEIKHNWQRKFTRIEFKNIFREQNFAADCLTKIGTFQEANWIDHEDPPPGMDDIIANDMMGATRVRRVHLS
ncbi:hypothetical protein DM860_007011 [Cuscuta australis]|uniref:Uncharacterized protein n=1 Tax=Cuscuta australis TaxID=267555 RepID=A0A328E9Q4_9ASTE|nr:hypothetical protein DM860_007011 [Cuscuta australis]